MQQSRSAKFALPPLDLTKAGLACATLEKENLHSDSIQPGVRSVEIGYFPHLIRSTGSRTRTPSSSQLVSHNEARSVPASSSNFIRKEMPHIIDNAKPLPSPEKRKKHACGHAQLEVLRRKLSSLEPYQEAIHNDNAPSTHAKTAPPGTADGKFLVSTRLPVSTSKLRKTAEETANMEPFSTAPILYFSVEEPWDGVSETSLVYEGQPIAVDVAFTKLEDSSHSS